MRRRGSAQHVLPLGFFLAVAALFGILAVLVLVFAAAAGLAAVFLAAVVPDPPRTFFAAVVFVAMFGCSKRIKESRTDPFVSQIETT
jgi:hypothetical protein